MNIYSIILIAFVIVILILIVVYTCKQYEMYTDFQKIKDEILSQKMRLCRMAKHKNNTPDQNEGQNNNFAIKYINAATCTFDVAI